MYQSNALWREGVCHSKYGDNITTDTHDTEEQTQLRMKWLNHQVALRAVI